MGKSTLILPPFQLMASPAEVHLEGAPPGAHLQRFGAVEQTQDRPLEVHRKPDQGGWIEGQGPGEGGRVVRGSRESTFRFLTPRSARNAPTLHLLRGSL